MMRTKLYSCLLMAIALFGIPAAYALPVGAEASWQQDAGFSFEEGYIGFLLGSNQENNKFNVSEPLVPSFAKQNFSDNESNVTSGVLAGYGVSYKHGYFGIEVSTQPLPISATANHTVSGDAVSDELTTYNIGNVDFIPGYYLAQNFLTYARLGVGANYYKLTQKNSGTTEFNSSEWTAGLRLGVGVDWRIAQHFGLGVDYTYSRYGNTDFGNQTSKVDGLKKDVELMSQTNNLIAAHLRYYF